MIETTEKVTWYKAAKAEDIPENGGTCIKLGEEQIAVFHFKKREEWYATSNMCPHKMQMAIGRGMIGDKNGEPKVACPFHKKNFSLKTGECLGEEGYKLKTYPVKVEDGQVFIGISNFEC
jgi:nitrite reductase (NADH) small subunit